MTAILQNYLEIFHMDNLCISEGTIFPFIVFWQLPIWLCIMIIRISELLSATEVYPLPEIVASWSLACNSVFPKQRVQPNKSVIFLNILIYFFQSCWVIWVDRGKWGEEGEVLNYKNKMDVKMMIKFSFTNKVKIKNLGKKMFLVYSEVYEVFH